MTEILETLVMRFTADLTPHQSGLQQVERDSRSRRSLIGRALTAGLTSALTQIDADLRGTGQSAGLGLTAGLTAIRPAFGWAVD